MTQKDYVKLAAVLRSARLSMALPIGLHTPESTWERIRMDLADTLAFDNPRFDRERFIQATEA